MSGAGDELIEWLEAHPEEIDRLMHESTDAEQAQAAVERPQRDEAALAEGAD